ncbi:MAG: CfrBI family restriction endonuclease [Bacteroidetes bacterium]|nr:CfrBI family restriction endonuclease [Bacteroidota bacterium]MBU2585497.1 CfrBI family restriction endonuclease [Bacteroidota bacterium]
MTLTDSVTQRIITKLIKGQDYRIEIVTLIDAEFLQYVMDFFKRIVDAKLKNQNVTIDWYKKELLDPNLSSNDIAINSGLNKKTISNMYNSATKEIVLEASLEHYDTLYESINSLIENDGDINITLIIKLRSVSVELNINETLIVINTLAVKRAALRGGLWSTAGKQVEKPLMMTLCKLFNVPAKHYDQSRLPKSMREVDFYLIGNTDKELHRCEVKLMGKGNPESADAVIARDSKVFIADKLSDLNKKQLSKLGIEWVELRSSDGSKRFTTVLKNLGIPFKDLAGNADERLPQIFKEVFR